jgi:hypothetical protein
MNLKSTAAGRGSREDKTYVKLDETLVSAAIPYVHVVRVHAVSLCACARDVMRVCICKRCFEACT